MPSGLLECQKGNQLKTTRWDFHFCSPVGAPQHANSTDSQPVSNKWDLQHSPPAQFHKVKEKRSRSCSSAWAAIPGSGSAHVPAKAPALDNLFDPFIFGDEGQSAELRTS
jgi:hypothetical protein